MSSGLFSYQRDKLSSQPSAPARHLIGMSPNLNSRGGEDDRQRESINSGSVVMF